MQIRLNTVELYFDTISSDREVLVMKRLVDISKKLLGQWVIRSTTLKTHVHDELVFLSVYNFLVLKNNIP